MFEWLSDIMRYVFITIIYYFMFSIIRLIAQDIKHGRMGSIKDDETFIKPLCNRSKLDFKIEELYTVNNNYTIGRGKKADIMINDRYMSAMQARFICEEGNEWMIHDLGSTNGTFVNNEQLGDEPCAIKTGDIIKMGQLSYIFVQPEEE